MLVFMLAEVVAIAHDISRLVLQIIAIVRRRRVDDRGGDSGLKEVVVEVYSVYNDTSQYNRIRGLIKKTCK
jgi:hypothetical protein